VDEKTVGQMLSCLFEKWRAPPDQKNGNRSGTGAVAPQKIAIREL
jgi:hypothetical protein